MKRADRFFRTDDRDLFNEGVLVAEYKRAKRQAALFLKNGDFSKSVIEETLSAHDYHQIMRNLFRVLYIPNTGSYTENRLVALSNILKMRVYYELHHDSPNSSKYTQESYSNRLKDQGLTDEMIDRSKRMAKKNEEIKMPTK